MKFSSTQLRLSTFLVQHSIFRLPAKHPGFQLRARKNPEAAGPRGAKDSIYFRAAIGLINLTDENYDASSTGVNMCSRPRPAAL